MKGFSASTEVTAADNGELTTLNTFINRARQRALVYLKKLDRRLSLDTREDIVADATVRLLSIWKEDERKTTRRAWKLLYTALIWCYNDYQRRRFIFSLDELLKQGFDVILETPDIEKRVDLENLLDRCESEDRAILVMSGQGMNTKQIADHLNREYSVPYLCKRRRVLYTVLRQLSDETKPNGLLSDNQRIYSLAPAGWQNASSIVRSLGRSQRWVRTRLAYRQSHEIIVVQTRSRQIKYYSPEVVAELRRASDNGRK